MRSAKHEGEKTELRLALTILGVCLLVVSGLLLFLWLDAVEEEDEVSFESGPEPVLALETEPVPETSPRRRVQPENAPRTERSAPPSRKISLQQDRPSEIEKPAAPPEPLVSQFGSLTIELRLHRLTLKRLGPRQDPPKIVAELKPERGVSPAFSTERVTLESISRDSRRLVLRGKTKVLQAVSWIVSIGGITAGRVTVEPKKNKTFVYSTENLRNRVYPRTLFVRDEEGRPLSGIEVLWMPAETKSPVMEGMLIGSTDTRGEFVAFDSGEGIFMARRPGGRPFPFKGQQISQTRKDQVSLPPRPTGPRLWKPGKLEITLANEESLGIRGRIFDARTLRPLPGALVEAYMTRDLLLAKKRQGKKLRAFRRDVVKGRRASYPEEIPQRTRTRDQGGFHLEVPPRQALILCVRHPRYAAMKPLKTTSSRIQDIPQEFNLQPGAVVVGFVAPSLLGAGKPKYVGCFNRSVDRPETARDGSYRIVGLSDAELVVGIAASPWTTNFVDLRRLTFRRGVGALSCNF